MRPTVIFDFDGTIALGEGPVDAYVAAVIAGTAQPGLAEAISGARDELTRDPANYRDGYHAVASAARKFGVTEQTLSTAYLDSRAVLGTRRAPVTTAPGLKEFLAELAQVARVELATNAPPVRLVETLDALGLAGAFEQVTSSAGKPAGMSELIAAAAERGPVLSVGDIDEYDLAPARALGAHTALVGATARTAATGQGGPDFAAERLEDLYEPIQLWAANPPSKNNASLSA